MHSLPPSLCVFSLSCLPHAKMYLINNGNWQRTFTIQLLIIFIYILIFLKCRKNYEKKDLFFLFRPEISKNMPTFKFFHLRKHHLSDHHPLFLFCSLLLSQLITSSSTLSAWVGSISSAQACMEDQSEFREWHWRRCVDQKRLIRHTVGRLDTYKTLKPLVGSIKLTLLVAER